MKTSETSKGSGTLKTSELLRKAADEIRRRGWYQGDYGSDLSDEGFKTCKVCSLGAINAVTGNGDPWYSVLLEGSARTNAIRALEGLLLEHDVSGTAPVVGWNDAPGRTVEEVLDVFSRAADAAEQAEQAAQAAEAEDS